MSAKGIVELRYERYKGDTDGGGPIKLYQENDKIFGMSLSITINIL